MGNLIRVSTAALTFLSVCSLSNPSFAAPDGGARQVAAVEMLVTEEPAQIEIESRISDASAQQNGRFEGNVTPLKRDISVLLSSESTMVRKHTARLPVGSRGAMIPIETVAINGGRADVVLPASPKGGVLVESRGKIQTIVTQGRATVIEKDGKTAIGALGGDLLVGKAGKFKALLQGSIRIFDHNLGTSREQTVLPAPQANAGGLAVALAGSAPVEVHSTRVKGAAHYRATLVDADGTSSGAAFQSTQPESIHVEVPHAGTFHVIVRAIDEFGIAGAPSDPTAIQVLGIENGADVVRHGMLLLSPGQSAKVLGQQGLVMRYGTSPEFVPAPSSLSLPGRKATTVEFRDPSDQKRFAVFKLAPRLLKTRIEMGPQLGLWPRDQIDIRVRMWDGHGHPLSWMDEYKLIVKVGVDEIPVDWQRSQGELTTVLPPQTGQGPWVVRVSVIDPTGNEIGRNFLEMIRPTPKKSPRKAKKRRKK